ncbi:helix-turn-helix domain-containing protein [Inquilinus limosus]|uniref:AraC family transcriptional regulator n=1 Tax=Inquilinus limosus TaxID=171674 RepID=UPI003F1655ED
MSALSRSVTTLTDVAQIGFMAANADWQYEQIEAGAFKTECTNISVGKSNVYITKIDKSIFGTTELKDESDFWITFVTGGYQDYYVNGNTINRGSTILQYGKYSTAWSVRSDYDFTSIILPISTSGAYEDFVRESAEKLMKQGYLIDNSLADRDDLLVRMLAAGMLDYLTDFPHCMGRFADAFIAHSWGIVLNSFRLHQPDASYLALPQRLKIFLKARDLLYRDELEAVNIPLLAKSVGVSERTLSYSFRSVVDQSPQTFLRTLRLNRARSFIIRHRGTLDNVVTEAAVTYGFWHLGRFSAYYKAQFGEYPSQTAGESSGRTAKRTEGIP